MSISLINKVIQAMCKEIANQEIFALNWGKMEEENLLYEAAICIFSSQSIFEVAVAMADRLREHNLLNPYFYTNNFYSIEERFINALSTPLPIANRNGEWRQIRPRFKNRQAYLLATTINKIYGQSLTIYGLLYSACHVKKAREILTQHVCGFGPKQASLFLRRVGYSDDLAVLDVHVLDYLQLAYNLYLSPSKLGEISFYEDIEDAFREIATNFGHSVGCVDLATWLTMRVAKREAFI
jgi:N-glycosylase/DNA lyase